MPYDRIIVTVGAWDIPPAWVDQLAEGGRASIHCYDRSGVLVVLYRSLHAGFDDEELLRSWFRDQVLHPHETQHTCRGRPDPPR